MSATKPTALTTIIWRHFRLEVPADWEMLRFSCNRERGRCSFADRYQVRLEMSWLRVPGPPDRERMLSDYMARLRDGGVEDLQPAPQANWSGLTGTQDGQTVSRFGNYFPGESCLLELVFLWPGMRDKQLEQRMLEAVTDAPAQDGQRRWRAFGLDVTVPATMALHECHQYAARTEMHFEAPKGVDEDRFMRLGLVSQWLRIPLKQWLAAQAPAGVSIQDQSIRTIDGHEMVTLRGRTKHWCRGLRLHRPVYESRAGLCPADGRLYFASHRRRARGQDLPSLLCSCGRAPQPRHATGKPAMPSPPPTGRDPAETWLGMLIARPIRNQAARVEKRGESVILHVRRENTMRPPLSWIVPVAAERKNTLDGIGLEVWTLCDGKNTVEDIIDRIAANHRLTFHESRASVTEYLKALTQRGILAMEMNKDVT